MVILRLSVFGPIGSDNWVPKGIHSSLGGLIIAETIDVERMNDHTGVSDQPFGLDVMTATSTSMVILRLSVFGPIGSDNWQSSPPSPESRVVTARIVVTFFNVEVSVSAFTLP
jgi:hypothetical protein